MCGVCVVVVVVVVVAVVVVVGVVVVVVVVVAVVAAAAVVVMAVNCGNAMCELWTSCPSLLNCLLCHNHIGFHECDTATSKA